MRSPALRLTNLLQVWAVLVHKDGHRLQLSGICGGNPDLSDENGQLGVTRIAADDMRPLFRVA
jgi:hypothetical protein